MPPANAIPVQIKKLDPDDVVPEYKKPGDAGFDLHALRRVEIPAGQAAIVPTGLAFAIPEGFEMQVRMRSGAALKVLCQMELAERCGQRGRAYLYRLAARA